MQYLETIHPHLLATCVGGGEGAGAPASGDAADRYFAHLSQSWADTRVRAQNTYSALGKHEWGTAAHEGFATGLDFMSVMANAISPIGEVVAGATAGVAVELLKK